MIALDFFLYDNRTWSPRWGRDWGLKAATGVLANRADLKAAFDRYCGATPGVQGQLRGFREAIGGVKATNRSGYLLCVTLESSDSFGRPSWAVFGLWCPDSSTLEQTLSTGDPIGSARALLGVETPPSAIEIRPATTAVGPRQRRRASADTAFYRFDPRSSVREVIALLLGAVQGRTAFPNVLGITATSRLTTLSQAGFDVAYCHPMDDQTERALARFLSPQEPEAEEPPPAGTTMTSADRQVPIHLPLAPSSNPHQQNQWLFWLSIGIVVTAAATMLFLLLSDVWHNAPAISRESPRPVGREEPDSGDTSALEVSAPEERPSGAVLDEVGERLEECKKLDPEDLRKSPGFVAAETIEVLPKYQEQRDRVRQSYAALIEIRGRMVKRQGNYVAYYYDEAGKDAAPDTKLGKIMEILGEAPLSSEDCQVLEEAFNFEFENEDSTLHRWCDTLGRLEKTAVQSLSIPLRHREFEESETP